MTVKNHTNIIAEIGINHNGLIDEAKSLILAAVESGCWGVKLQYRNLSTFYQNANEIGDELILSDLIRTQLHLGDYIKLLEFSKSLGIKVGISFFRIEDAKDFNTHLTKFDFFKIPSAECLNYDLISFLLKTGNEVFVSTGGHQPKQLARYLLEFSEKISVFHCIANYPTKLGNQQFDAINQLKVLGFKNVGYSSHDQDYEVCLMALHFGVNYIERHITLDKKAQGLDHSSSSTPKEFKKIVYFSNNYNSMVSPIERFVNQGEKINMQNLGVGLYYNKNLKSGQRVKSSDYVIKAPRIGVSMGEFKHSLSKEILKRDVIKGESLRKLDFIEIHEFSMDKLVSFAINHNIALPVRLHDFDFFRKEIPINNFEFHLSYKEVLEKNWEKLNNINSDLNFSIHLPDYIPGQYILDPISANSDVAKSSNKIISLTIDFANKIYEVTGKKVNIVGSFSRLNGSRKDTFLKLHKFIKEINEINKDSCEMLPQWLPGYAWYFGGSEKLNIFNTQDDIDMIKETNFKICLDICHLGMSAAEQNVEFQNWYDQIFPYSKHFHFADYSGIDGEGIQFGEGDLEDYNKLLSHNYPKVLEIWQGHLDSGLNFKNGIRNLELLKKGLK